MLKFWAKGLLFQRFSHSGKGLIRAAVAQEVEWVVYLSDGWCFNLQLLRCTYQSVLGQDTEPQIAPNGCYIGVRMCVYEFLMVGTV